MICILFVYIAGLFKGTMDTLQFHYSKAFSFMRDENFWNPKMSWRNKYKDIDGDGIGDVFGGPRFPRSTTFFVAFTDGWHLIQLGFLFFITAAIVTYTPTYNLVLDFVLIRIAFFVGFKNTYR